MLSSTSSLVKRKLPDWILLASKKKQKKIVFIFNERFLNELIECIENAVEMLSLGRKYRIEYLFEDKQCDFHFIDNCGLWNVLDLDLVLKGLQYLFPGTKALEAARNAAHDEQEMLDLLMQTLEEIRQLHFWELHLINT
jgi:hypothetical protein